MRILHYMHGLPPVRDGGLVKYALDLAEGERKAGNEILFLVPGKFNVGRKSRTRIISGNWKGILCYKIINPLLVTEGKRIAETECLTEPGDAEVYDSFLKEICPDIIHIHSLMGIHLSFFQEAKKLSIPIVFTTHDYYGLCPKVTLLRNNDKICDLKDWNACAQCMGIPVSKRKQEWKHSNLYEIVKKNRLYQWMEYSKMLLPYKQFVRSILIKKKNCSIASIITEMEQENVSKEYEILHTYYREMLAYVSFFHFNSQQSRQVYESFLENIKGKVVSLTNKRVKDCRKVRTYSGKLKIGYLSSRQAFKGYGYLMDTLDAMYRAGMTEFECQIYFNPKDAKCPYICSHAPYKEKDMQSVFENMDILVMPSIWKETFGLVVLEALSFGVPVIVSSHVGAKELLEEQPGMGIVIDIEKDKGKLLEVLKLIYCDRKILSDMNKQICRWDREWDFDGHVTEILNLYHEIC